MKILALVVSASLPFLANAQVHCLERGKDDKALRVEMYRVSKEDFVTTRPIVIRKELNRVCKVDENCAVLEGDEVSVNANGDLIRRRQGTEFTSALNMALVDNLYLRGVDNARNQIVFIWNTGVNKCPSPDSGKRCRYFQVEIFPSDRPARDLPEFGKRTKGPCQAPEGGGTTSQPGGGNGNEPPP